MIIDESKTLDLNHSGQQRKLLIAFERYLHDEYGESIVSGSIDEFLKHIGNNGN